MNYLRMWILLKGKIKADLQSTDEKRRNILMDLLLEMEESELEELETTENERAANDK